MGNDPWMLTVLAAGTALLAGLFLALSLRRLRKGRLIRDLPTSKVRGVFIGLVEVKGVAQCAAPLRSRLAAVACVWYDWSVEEHWSKTELVTVRDSKGRRRTRTRHTSGWSRVAGGNELTPFRLADETGSLRIQPAGAELEGVCVFSRECGRSDPLYYQHGPGQAVMHSDHRRRLVERAIPLGAQLYVFGQARERADAVAAEIARGEQAPFFLISMRSEEEIRAGCRVATVLLGLAGALAAAAGGWLAQPLVGIGGPVPPWLWPVPLYGCLFLAGWTWVVFNGLLALHHRVRQARTLIDIQLKRRHDLVPQLAAAVGGLRGHEREVQELLAALRAESGPLAAAVRGVVERCPELAAGEAFLALQKALADTEDRIALARNYYLEIATFHNTRLAAVPDGWVARLAGLRPAPLPLPPPGG
ncbi:MAG: LemA family protein [Lentisphaeria bacterium]|jgi:hypothetical protein